jgi:CubicO group peptidase (beta-lactamase class C family)
VTLDHQYWTDRLVALAEKHGVVGASLAVGVGEEDCVAATGVLSRRTGQPATPDSVFQIGSITKVWTATLVMQLVDDGLVDLDQPIVTYLPDLRVADADLTSRLTTRHLLSHTSGIDGDLFVDTGRGDDCLERYVAAMSDLRATHALGATMSYCNAGYSVLGRLVEVLRDSPWDAVLRDRLLAPLGLTATGTLPEEALLWGAAVGHLTPPGAAEPIVAPQWGLPRSVGPAGLIHAPAREVVAFARMHLAGGVAADGARVLSAESARAMREPQVAVPDRWTLGDHWGLGWALADWGGEQVLVHDGSTIGQHAYLRALPATDRHPSLTVVLLGNCGASRDLAHALFAEIFESIAGVSPTARPEPPSEPPAFNPSTYVGTYARESMRYTVQRQDDGLRLVIEASGPVAASLGVDRMEAPLLPYSDDVFLTEIPGVPGFMPAVFYSLADGSHYLHLGARATPYVGATTSSDDSHSTSAG